jgi:hypothetical protein
MLMPPTISEILARAHSPLLFLAQQQLILETPWQQLALMLGSAAHDAALIYLAALCAWRSLAFRTLIDLSNQ